ncbi:MAG: proton-conducting membrane transporter [Lachnospiraceae bacterium]|nr:proton-conducting membrane transporter [Lachnospiraceae bacterium]
MDGNILILIAILLPIFLGAIFPALKFLKSDIAKNAYLACSVFASGVLAMIVSYACNGTTLMVFKLTESLPVFMRTDSISAVFATLVTVIWSLVLFYAFGYMKEEEETDRFFAFYLMVYGSLLGLCFSGNLVSMYLFYELMTLLSFPLVLHERTKEAVLAGLKYLFYSIGGAFVALFFFFVIYREGVSLDFVAGGSMAPFKGNTLMQVSTLLVLIGFGCKAGMFPLHAWLPTAHPVAPTPASAVLSGIITKAGVLAIFRIVFFVIGVDFIRGSWVHYTWLALTLFTVFMGSMLAYREPLLKKRLAYSSVSQVSYVLFDFATLSPVGILGGLLHVIFHSAIKNTLFLCAGAYIEKTGRKRVDELTGIGKTMPYTTWCFTIAGLALIGIPPLSGFVSKWYLCTGSLDSGTGFFSWLGPVILLLSALLTAGYLLPVTVKGFLPGKDFEPLPKNDVGPLMLVPMIVLASLTALLGIFSTPLCDCLIRILESLSI